MKPNHVPLALALALAVAALAPGCARDAPPATAAEPAAIELAGHDAAAHSGDHEAHGSDAHAHDVAHAAGVDFPVPEDHVKWEPDGPLIEGMSRVRAAIGDLEQASDEDTVRAAAAEVDAAIDYMFENCSLPVEPDIALHAVLARLMAGTQALADDPSDATPVHDMHGAVTNYEELFDDPNT